jgi:AmiR/NasT family two-component response regulator
VRELQIRAGELQHALDSRVAIEQAKGMVAERAKVDMDEAFRRLRTHSRAKNRRLTGLAVDVVSGAIALDTVCAAGAPEPHRRP